MRCVTHGLHLVTLMPLNLPFSSNLERIRDNRYAKIVNRVGKIRSPYLKPLGDGKNPHGIPLISMEYVADDTHLWIML